MFKPTLPGGRTVGILNIEKYENILTSRSNQYIWWILGAALLIRIIAAISLANTNPATANLWEYGTIAMASVQHGGIVAQIYRPDGSAFICPTAFMPPLLIFIEMGIFWVFGITSLALKVMIALNVIFSTLVVLYTQKIARALFESNVIAALAALMIAVHPVFVFSVATYHAVNLYLFLFLFLIYCIARDGIPTAKAAIIAGAAWALATLARTEYLILGGAVMLWTIWYHKQWRMTILAGFVAALFILPWTVRNYVVFGQLIPIADSAGYNLYKGFNPDTNGSGHWVDVHQITEKRLGKQLAAVPFTHDYEIRTNRVYLHAAEAYIRTAPVSALVALTIRKILLFWFFDIYDPTTHALLYQLSVWPTIVLSALGLAIVQRRRLGNAGPLGLVLVLFAAETVVMAMYAVHARYRMNVEPFLFAFAAIAIVSLSAKVFRRRDVPPAG